MDAVAPAGGCARKPPSRDRCLADDLEGGGLEIASLADDLEGTGSTSPSLADDLERAGSSRRYFSGSTEMAMACVYVTSTLSPGLILGSCA